jgi:hypothetical protein
MSEMLPHQFIIVRGVRYYNTNKISFRAIYGNGFIEYYGPKDAYEIISTDSRVPVDEIEEKLARLGFNKSGEK